MSSPMIRYWKTEEKSGEWKTVDDTPDAIAELVQATTVRHMTILAIDKPFTDETPQSSVKYIGDMYFDIDCKPEEVGGTKDDAIAAAIKSCQDLVAKLKGVQASGLKIYASGSKGFHVILPKENFGKIVPQAYLHETYCQIAVHFKVDWLDMGIYSGRKGRMFRQPNVRRPSGTYKVPLSEAELQHLTPENYHELVSQQRIGFQFERPARSDSLAGIFSMAKKLATDIRKDREKLEKAQPKEDLAGIHKEGLPGCIDRLVTVGDEKDGSNFNQAALQLATYCKDAGLSKDEVRHLCQRMAANVKSGTYDSETRRFHAIFSVYEGVRSQPYHFSKGGLFSVITKCGNCPLCQAKAVGPDGIEIDERLKVIVGSRGYEQGFGKYVEPATNFHLKTKAVKMQYPVAWHSIPKLRERDRRPAGLVLEMTIFDSLGQQEPILVNMPEDAVNTPTIARDILVKSGGSWLCPPDFWNRLRLILTDRGNLKKMEAETITTVPHFGISVFLREGERVAVYCDPNSCLISDPEFNEVFRTEFPEDPKGLKVANASSRMPNMAHLPPFSVNMERGRRGYDGEKLAELVTRLSKVVPDAEAATIMGWMCCAHLKAHLRAVGVRFPLLNLYGLPESGKTATATLMLTLHGVHSTESDPLVDVSQSTPVSVREKLSQSSSVPTILDEFNQSMQQDRYMEIVNILKSAWDQNSASKMVANGGMRDMVATSPIITCGEQTISSEHRSLRTRTLEVAFNLEWKKDKDRTANYRKVSAQMDKLASFGLDLIVEAVQGVDVDWVQEKYLDHLDTVPRVYGSDRKTEGYAMCLVGLDLLEQACHRQGADVSERISELKAAITNFTENVEEGQIESETDRIFSRLVMAVANQEFDLDPSGPKLPKAMGRWVRADNKIRMLPSGAYRTIKSQARGEFNLFRMSPEDFNRTIRTATPDYVHIDGDGYAWLSVEDMRARGWWQEPEVEEPEEF